MSIDMPTNGTTRGSTLEAEADQARDALAANVRELETRAEEGAELAEGVVARARGLDAPIVLGGAAAAIAALALGRSLLRVAGPVVLGAVGGLAAGAAMTQFHRAWRKTVGDEGEPDETPATVKAAAKVAGPTAIEKAETAGNLAHYAMSALTGGVYGAVTKAWPLLGFGRGVGYGFAVWATADEIAVPAFGLSRAPWDYPMKTHVRGLLAHLVYGATLDAVVRGVRALAV